MTRTSRCWPWALKTSTPGFRTTTNYRRREGFLIENLPSDVVANLDERERTSRDSRHRSRDEKPLLLTLVGGSVDVGRFRAAPR